MDKSRQPDSEESTANAIRNNNSNNIHTQTQMHRNAYLLPDGDSDHENRVLGFADSLLVQPGRCSSTVLLVHQAKG